MKLASRVNSGAHAVDGRLTSRAKGVAYNPPAQPGAAWGPDYNGGATAGMSSTPEVSTLLILTVAELAALAGLRHLFRRYHGG